MAGRVIHIPFREDMQAAILRGAKTMTTRSKRYGEVGDFFKLGGRFYRLVSVRRVELGAIAHAYYRQEGCATPAEFRDIWVQIHPRKGWTPMEKKWLHEFRDATQEIREEHKIYA